MKPKSNAGIRQRLSDWCEERGQRTKGIRREIFWHKLSWWVLNP